MIRYMSCDYMFRPKRRLQPIDQTKMEKEEEKNVLDQV